MEKVNDPDPKVHTAQVFSHWHGLICRDRRDWPFKLDPFLGYQLLCNMSAWKSGVVLMQLAQSEMIACCSLRVVFLFECCFAHLRSDGACARRRVRASNEHAKSPALLPALWARGGRVGPRSGFYVPYIGLEGTGD